MRHRRWVLILAVILLGIIPATLVALRVATRRPAVRSELLSRFVPSIDGTIEVGDLVVGAASVRFTDVRIRFENGSSIVLPSGSASVSYREFALNGFDLGSSLSTLILTDPSITLRVGGSPDDDGGGGAEVGESSDGIELLMRSLPDYLGISGGSVTVLDDASGRCLLIGDLDMLLERTPEGDLDGRAGGAILSGGVSNLSAQVHLDEDGLSVLGQLEEAQISPDIYLPLPDEVAVLDGSVSAGFHVRAAVGEDVALRIDAKLREASFEIAGTDTVDAVEGALVYEDTRVALEGINGRWRGAEFSLRGGDLEIGTGAVRGMTLEATGVPARFVREIGREGLPTLEGRFSLTADLSGRISEPVAEVTIDSEHLVIAGIAVTDVAASGRYSGGAVEIEHAGAALLGGALSAQGTLATDHETGKAYVELRGEVSTIDLAELAALGWAEELAGRASLNDIVLMTRGGRHSGELLVGFEDVRYGELALGSGAGGLLVRDETAYVTLSSSEMGYELSGEVELGDGDQRIDGDVLLSGLRGDALVAGPAGRYLPVKLDGPIHVAGSLPEVDIDGIVGLTAEEAAATVRVTGRVRSAESGSELALMLESDDASARGVELPFAAELSVSPGALTLNRLEAAGFANASGTLTLGETPSVRASAVLSEAPAKSAYRLVTGGAAPASLDGLAFMSASVRGPVGDLAGSGQLQLARASVGDVSGLDAVLVADLAAGAFSIREAAIEHDGIEILRAEGSVELGGALTLALHGNGIPGPLMGGDEDTGFSLAMGVDGTIDSPTFDCRVESESGEFLGVPFDRFLARATGASGDISLDQLTLDRVGSYRVRATGRAPLGAVFDPDGPAEGELTLEVEDDPIALIGAMTGVLDEAAGDGRMMLHFVGDRESFSLVRGDVDARASRVRGTGVFDELTDVVVSASIVDGVLAEGWVTAAVDGRRIEVASRRSMLIDGRLLEPLEVGGVDVGILAVTTDERGVEVSIPGLMEQGDVGRAAASGHGDIGELLVAGPAEHPLLWGDIAFSDMSFTYPFSSSNGSPLSGDFFSRAEWSLRLTAGRNLWYRRPDASLKIDRGTGFDFAGVPEDHTFCVAGRATSSRGTITYLNADFDVRTAFIDFPSFCEPPRFYIEGTTRTNDGTEITLSVVAAEQAGAALAGTGTPFDESTVLLRSDAPEDVTREDVLERLTYGSNRESLEEEDIATLERRRAIEVVASQVGVMVVRPLFSPVEGRMKRTLGLDLVRIDVDFVEHFLYQIDQWRAQEGAERYQPFLADSRLTLGKYFAHDWLLSYEASAEAYEASVGRQSIGAQHEFGIEYEVSRNTSLSLKAVYDPTLSGWDRRISIENRFWF